MLWRRRGVSLRLLLAVDTSIASTHRHLEERDWGELRGEIDESVKDLLYRQGYERSDVAISPTYPLARITVQYESSQGPGDSFKIEIGYMRRYLILKEDALADFRHIGTQETFPIKTLEGEELFALC